MRWKHLPPARDGLTSPIWDPPPTIIGFPFIINLFISSMFLISRHNTLFNKIITSNNPISCKPYLSKYQKFNFIINQYILIHSKF
jgi:hypothetical protein